MTVETEVTRVILQGNAVLTTWSYTFPIPGSTATDQTNAELIFTDTASVSTTLANNLWSITGVDTGVGGTVTYNPGSPITTGSTVTLVRIVPYEQTTSLSAQGAYSPAVVEAALDNLAFQTEQLNTRMLQAIRAPLTEAALNDLPPAANRASSYLFFDSSGQPTTASVTGGIPTSILVGTDSTHSTLTTALHMTGSGVTSVVTVAGVTTATLTAGTGLSTTLTSTHIYVGNGSNVATDVAMSGDATMANTGALTVANSAVTNAKMANMNAHTYKGNNTGSGAAPADISAANVLVDIAAAPLAGATFTGAVNGKPTITLTDAAPTTWSLAGGNTFTWTLGSSHLLSNPTGGASGFSGVIYINQASHTATFDTNIKLVGSLPASGETICSYFVNGSNVTIVVGGATGF